MPWGRRGGLGAAEGPPRVVGSVEGPPGAAEAIETRNQSKRIDTIKPREQYNPESDAMSKVPTSTDLEYFTGTQPTSVHILMITLCWQCYAFFSSVAMSLIPMATVNQMVS